MTEQQFEKIKILLDASNPVEPSFEQDNLILNLAKQQAELSRHEQVSEKSSINIVGSMLSWLGNISQGAIPQAAVLSIAFTLVMFFGLAQLLSSDSKTLLVTPEATVIEFQASDITPREDSVLAYSRLTTEKPNLDFKMPDTQKARDQILAHMSLPNIDVLIEDMALPQNTDGLDVESMISIAMIDIRLMLDDGKLNDARVRYTKLRERCSECPLPSSLEALVTNSLALTGNT